MPRVMYLPRWCTCLGVYLPGGYLPGGVPTQVGVPAQGWCTYPGGVPAWGCTCHGGYLPSYLPLWTEWQTGAKILPCPKLRLRAVNIPGSKEQCHFKAGCIFISELMMVLINENRNSQTFKSIPRTLVSSEFVVKLWLRIIMNSRK